ncbi:MAG: HPt (histidine-containing phosphotransfer) domain-containing protein [Bermanella sp.]|jgi:HPt (histidine-containing phosphotransfer) domain-containing protein
MSTNLPILNYDFALNQLGGNEALLSKMLNRFVDEFAKVSAEIISLIQAHDIQNAKMKVHTVKGISGNIGLQALFDCATRFDAELRSGEVSEAILEEFRTLVLRSSKWTIKNHKNCG